MRVIESVLVTSSSLALPFSGPIVETFSPSTALVMKLTPRAHQDVPVVEALEHADRRP